MSEQCTPHHDVITSLLTAGLCVGLVLSYLPQHYRIISKKSSEGFSPWFLLLGSTSSAAGMLNIVVLQWGLVRCCKYITGGQCVESTAGIFQLSLQWFMFNMIFVLYMIYYPAHLKYVTVEVDLHDDTPIQHVKTNAKRSEWKLSIGIAWAVLLHLLFIIFVTFIVLTGDHSPNPMHRSRQMSWWATFLGVESTTLAAFQYIPQIVHTYRHKLVGALSIGMMCIQTPGAILMVLSVALRPGTDWTTWSSYALAGILQGTLLVMCLFWRVRQKRLGIDDFGNPLNPQDEPAFQDSPIPVTRGLDEDVSVVTAVEDAVEANIHTAHQPETSEVSDEETPLLKKDTNKSSGWLGWLFSSRA